MGRTVVLTPKPQGLDMGLVPVHDVRPAEVSTLSAPGHCAGPSLIVRSGRGPVSGQASFGGGQGAEGGQPAGAPWERGPAAAPRWRARRRPGERPVGHSVWTEAVTGGVALSPGRLARERPEAEAGRRLTVYGAQQGRRGPGERGLGHRVRGVRG